MKEKIVTTGIITDLSTERKYVLSGVKQHNNHIDGGNGYCLVIRDDINLPLQYILTLVTEVSYKGSVANKTERLVIANLKDFIYEGREYIDGK